VLELLDIYIYHIYIYNIYNIYINMRRLSGSVGVAGYIYIYMYIFI